MMLPGFLERVVKQFRITAQVQEGKGMQKYGKPLEPIDPKYDWLEMAEEELVDGYKYLLAEREKRDHLLLEIKKHVEYMAQVDSTPVREHARDLILAKISLLSRNINLQ